MIDFQTIRFAAASHMSDYDKFIKAEHTAEQWSTDCDFQSPRYFGGELSGYDVVISVRIWNDGTVEVRHTSSVYADDITAKLEAFNRCRLFLNALRFTC
jgi:hypothetical protein